jgi:hypothetical protein
MMPSCSYLLKSVSEIAGLGNPNDTLTRLPTQDRGASEIAGLGPLRCDVAAVVDTVLRSMFESRGER